MTVRALPTLRFKDPDVQRAYDAIREALQEGNGDRGNPNNRWLTVGDAVNGTVTRFINSSTPTTPVTPPVTPPVEPPVNPPIQSTVVLTISPAKPDAGENFTLTATVSGNTPTGAVHFRQNGDYMTAEPYFLPDTLTVSHTASVVRGMYTFVAEYSGDERNLASVSNAITVEIGSVWDGPPPPPTSLTASTDDPFQIYLKWTNPYIGDYAVTEVWGVKSNPPSPMVSAAIKLGEVASTEFILTEVNGVALDSGENWYFWVRNRDTENLTSTWFPTAGGTNGKTGIQPGKYLDILTGSITETHLFQSLGEKIDLIVPLDQTVTGIESDITVLQEKDIELAQAISLVSAGATGFDVKDIWYFVDATEITGWTTNALTGFTVTGGKLVVNASGASPWFQTVTLAENTTYKPVPGGEYPDVHIRVKRVAGTEWAGILTYTTSTGATYTKTIAEPTYSDSGYGIADWEMSSDTSWTGNTITKLRVQLGAGSGDNFLVDWMSVGRYAPSASAAQVVDLAKAQVGYCVVNGSPTGHTSKATCEAAGGQWLGNYPLATAVKQVAVLGSPYCVLNGEVDASKTTQSACETAGGKWNVPGTAAIEQLFQALQQADGELYAQYSVKIDNNGYVSGFGLASEPVNGVPYSDFMVRADRFSISSPTIPTWQKSVTGISHNGATATVVTGTAHGYSTGHYVMLANVADKYWNRTFKITSVGTTSFTIKVDATQEMCLNPSAARATGPVPGKSIYCTRVTVPFIVTTTTTEENGVTIEPGVYIDMAQIKDATIEEAKIRDAAITNVKIGSFIESKGWGGQYGPAGWRMEKNTGSVQIKGSLALYDSDGTPIITGGKINFRQFRRLTLTAQPAEVFTVAKNTGAITPTSIDLIASLQNIGANRTVNWYVTQGTYDGKTAGQLLRTDTAVNNSTKLQVLPASFGSGVTVVGFKATCIGDDSITYDDTFTIAKLAEGSDTVWMYLSNENDSLPSDSAGNLTSITSITSEVKVYRGATEEAGWTIAASTASAGTTATYASGRVTVTLSAASPDRVVATVTATKSGSPTQTRLITVTKQKQGGAGSNAATLTAYKRSAATPTDNPGAVMYTFANASWAPGNGWSRTIPTGTDPIWAVAASASSTASTDDIAANEWSAPVKIAEDGVDGLNVATVFIYQRTNTDSAPGKPTANVTYSFTNATVSNLLNGWSASVPSSGGAYLWVTTATAASTGTSDVITPAEWAAVQKLATDGANGSYVSYVFLPSTSRPATPTSTSPIPSGWYDSPPSSAYPIWMSKATVTNGVAGTWSLPIKVTGTDGLPGDDGNITSYQYAKNTSTTTAPGVGWQATPYALIAGEYQWMRTVTLDPNTNGVTYGSPFRVTGEKGDQGAQGPTGTRGGIFIQLSGVFSDAAAWSAIVQKMGTNPVPGDWVQDVNGSAYQLISGTTSPGNWGATSFQIHGNAVVQGTLSAEALTSQLTMSKQIQVGLSAGDTNAYIKSGGYNGSVNDPNANPGTTGWCINANGDAAFNSVLVRNGANIGANALSWTAFYGKSGTLYSSLGTVTQRWFNAGGSNGDTFQVNSTSGTPTLDSGSFPTLCWTDTNYPLTIPRAAGRTSTIVCSLTFEGPVHGRGNTVTSWNNQNVPTGYSLLSTGSVDGVWLALVMWDPSKWNATKGNYGEWREVALQELFYMDSKDIHSRFFSGQCAFSIPNAAAAPFNTYATPHIRIKVRHSAGSTAPSGYSYPVYSGLKLVVHSYVE